MMLYSMYTILWTVECGLALYNPRHHCKLLPAIHQLNGQALEMGILRLNKYLFFLSLVFIF